jgi:hypothetical protein
MGLFSRFFVKDPEVGAALRPGRQMAGISLKSIQLQPIMF